MNKLLKDAIADAKAVRETALANAKLALEEAFAPKLQSMLSSKIREEMEEEEPAAEDENVDPNAENYGADQDTEMENRMKELAGISEEEDEDMGSDEEDMDYSDEDDMGDDDMGGEEDFSDEESSEDDVDLEEILRELEDGESSESSNEDMEDESTMMEEFDLDEIINSLREEEGSEEEEEMEEEEVDLNELLASLEEDTENYKETDDQAMDTPGSKHGRKNPGGAPDDESEDVPADNVREGRKTKMKMKKMEEEINEAYRAVKYLRTKLSEVNLLNAKLLYVNKLFRNNLTETQKVKVIENFDRAKTVREAKLVYATLAESLKAAKVSTTKANQTKKSVMEGFASKATKNTKSVLNEGNDQINRFKKLAGLI